MKTNVTFALMMTAGMAMAQVMIPDGTKIRVHLEEDLSSDTAQLGAPVELVVTEEVRIGDTVVIASGARATGNIVKVSAQPPLEPLPASSISPSSASRRRMATGTVSATPCKRITAKTAHSTPESPPPAWQLLSGLPLPPSC